jgi:hypothetical protein
MLAIFMVLPRLKPYYFIVLVIPLYFLFKDRSDKIKILVLAVISLLPIFAWYIPVISRNYSEIYFIGSLTYLISQYAQTIGLFLVFGISIALEYYRPVSSPADES